MIKYNKDVFVYCFDQPPENATVETGTAHFQEVAYVFSNQLLTQNPLSTRKGDKELAIFMTSSWISFVHDVNPDFKGRT
jgi:acetylcholinesterase